MVRLGIIYKFWQLRSMDFIYERVVDKLREDSIARYEERKRDWRLKNKIPNENDSGVHNKVIEPIRATVPIRQNIILSQDTTTLERPPRVRNFKQGNRKKQEETPCVSNPQPTFEDQPIRPQVAQEQVVRPIKPTQTEPDPFPSEMAEVELVPCPAGCGRKFNKTSIARHAKICKKVFQTKTEAVDFADKREAAGMDGVQRTQIVEDKNKKANYKAQSAAFRLNLKKTKGEKLTAEEEQQLQAVEQMDLVKCNKCGRKFDKDRVQKHQSVCKAKK